MDEPGPIARGAGAARERRGGADGVEAEALRSMSRLIAELGSTLELDQMLAGLAAGIREPLCYDTFAVLLLDDLGHELHFSFAVGFPEEVVRNWRFGLGQGIVGTAALTQRAVRVDDVRSDPRYLNAAPDLRSELALPLVVKGRTIGVLDVGSRRPGHFDASDEQLLTFLAGYLANGIENARLYGRVREQARTMSLQHELSRELTSILDREELLRTVTRLVKRVIDYQLFSVMLWNDETQLLEHTFSLRHDERFVQKGGFPLGHGVTGTVAALRQPMRVPNVHLNPHYRECGHGVEVRSELAIPLVFKDRLIGVLDLESVHYNAFTEQHELMLATLASSLAIALENARLYEKIREGERRLAEELATAREIQKGLLPDRARTLPGLDVAYAYRPARELGGDFYDFLPYGEGRLAVAVGDVAGKAAPAALYGSLAVGIMRGHAVGHFCEPGEMLLHLNEHLGQLRLDNRYVALVFAVYDGADSTLRLANAGFPRPLHVRDGEVRTVSVAGIPLGLLPDARYEQRAMRLEPGDAIVLCSDGIHECIDRQGEEFGPRRMKALLAELAEQGAQAIADGLLAATDRFGAGPGEPGDDRTVVVLKVSGETPR